MTEPIDRCPGCQNVLEYPDLERDPDASIDEFETDDEGNAWHRVCRERANGRSPRPSTPTETERLDSLVDSGRPPNDYAALVAREIERQRAQRDARAILAAEDSPPADLPAAETLTAALLRPPRTRTYLIESVWPIGGRVLLAAQWKAGKTTMRNNVVRALVDGTDLFATFAVPAPVGLVHVLDFEMDRDQGTDWLRALNLQRTDRVKVSWLRGLAHRFDVRDDATRARWVAYLAGVDVLVVDCLRPILDALGLAEANEAGLFLNAFERMLAEAGIRHVLLVHHMGHAGQRSRGDSRLLDWPDATWSVTRVSDEGLDVDPAAPRYFQAYGRDVDVPESALTHDAATGGLTIVQGQSHGRAKLSRDVRTVLRALVDLALEPASERTGRKIEVHLLGRMGQKRVRDALGSAKRQKLATAADGPKNATVWSITDAGRAEVNDEGSNDGSR
jgi:AAA domain